MTTITLPPYDVIRVNTFADLPAQSIDGLLGVVKNTDALYVYDSPTATWILISSSIFVSTVTDTNSIDLTVLLGNLSADLRLSSNAAAANNTLVSLNIESTGVVGLRAQIANSSVRALLSATAPVTYDNSTGIIAMPVSTNAVDGYLSAADHTTFNAKVGPTRAVNTTAPLTGGGALSSDLTLAIAKSTTIVDGYLAAADFTIFNNKVATTRSISTTAPLAGGGNLSADRTLSITQSATAVDGYLSSVDWNTFNNKVGTTRSISTTAPLAGGGNLSADRTLSITQSATAADGYLSSTDWNTFNNKVATTRAINTTAPITGGGNLSADRTIAMAASTNAVDGYLTAADHTTFAAKQTAITVGSLGAGNANGLDLTTGTLTLHAGTSTQPGAITTAAQTIAGAKTFNNDIIKPTLGTNNSFRTLITPETTFASATNLQTCSATFGATGPLLGYVFMVTSTATNDACFLFASYATATISAMSDPGNLFLSSDAGTGIYISKTAASNVLSFKNRTGGASTIAIISFNATVTSIGAWA